MVWPSEDFGKIEMALDVKKVPHPCHKGWGTTLELYGMAPSQRVVQPRW